MAYGFNDDKSKFDLNNYAHMTWSNINLASGTWATHTGGTGIGVNANGDAVINAYNLNLNIKGKYYVFYKATFRDGTNKSGLRGIRFYIGEVNSGEEFVAPSGNNTTITTFRFIDTSNLSNTNIRMGLYQNDGSSIVVTNIEIIAIRIYD